MATFGEVSWDDNFFGEGNKKDNKDIWLRLDNGSNEMRLVTQPFQYLSHRYKKEGDPGFGQKVYCSQIHGHCPLCAMGDKPKPRWLLGVITRKDNTYKILDISYAVFSDIRKLAKNVQRWGDPTKYDIDIVVDKKGGPTGYYSVQPIGKEPLSADDQKIKDSVDLDELKAKVTPPTPDKVQKRLDKINGVAEGASSASTPATSTTASPVSMDDDDSFPAYNS